MGVGISSPPPPIDLLPPRFTYHIPRDGDPSVTPIRNGGDARSALFSQPFAPVGASLSARLAAAPDGSTDVAINVHADGRPRSSSSSAITNGTTFTAAAHGRTSDGFVGAAALDVDGGTRALAAHVGERGARATWALFSAGGAHARALGDGFAGEPQPSTTLALLTRPLLVSASQARASVELGTRVRAFDGALEAGAMADALPPFPASAWVYARHDLGVGGGGGGGGSRGRLRPPLRLPPPCRCRHSLQPRK